MFDDSGIGAGLGVLLFLAAGFLALPPDFLALAAAFLGAAFLALAAAFLGAGFLTPQYVRNFFDATEFHSKTFLRE